jgi:hypothetical protein
VNGAFVALKITVCVESGAVEAVTVPAESFVQFNDAHEPFPTPLRQYEAESEAIPNVSAVFVAVKLYT